MKGSLKPQPGGRNWSLHVPQRHAHAALAGIDHVEASGREHQHEKEQGRRQPAFAGSWSPPSAEFLLPIRARGKPGSGSAPSRASQARGGNDTTARHRSRQRARRACRIRAGGGRAAAARREKRRRAAGFARAGSRGARWYAVLLRLARGEAPGDAAQPLAGAGHRGGISRARCAGWRPRLRNARVWLYLIALPLGYGHLIGAAVFSRSRRRRWQASRDLALARVGLRRFEPALAARALQLGRWTFARFSPGC